MDVDTGPREILGITRYDWDSIRCGGSPDDCIRKLYFRTGNKAVSSNFDCQLGDLGVQRKNRKLCQDSIEYRHFLGPEHLTRTKFHISNGTYRGRIVATKLDGCLMHPFKHVDENIRIE